MIFGAASYCIIIYNRNKVSDLSDGSDCFWYFLTFCDLFWLFSDFFWLLLTDSDYLVKITDNVYSRELRTKVEEVLVEVKLLESWYENWKNNDPEQTPPTSASAIMAKWTEIKDIVEIASSWVQFRLSSPATECNFGWDRQTLNAISASDLLEME